MEPMTTLKTGYLGGTPRNLALFAIAMLISNTLHANATSEDACKKGLAAAKALDVQGVTFEETCYDYNHQEYLVASTSSPGQFEAQAVDDLKKVCESNQGHFGYAQKKIKLYCIF